MKLEIRRRVFTLSSKYYNCESTSNLQIDHIYPKSKCGSDVLGNRQVLCSKCNKKKNNKFHSMFSYNKEVKS